jgi:hypothetical protein
MHFGMNLKNFAKLGLDNSQSRDKLSVASLIGYCTRFDNHESGCNSGIVRMSLDDLMSIILAMVPRDRTTVYSGDVFAPCTSAPVDG